MYELFDNLIEIYGLTDDKTSEQWFDMYYEDGCNLLDKFDEEDWMELKEELQNKSNPWKECMVFCFGDNNNQHEIDILNELSNTEDEQLFIAVADKIRLCFDYDKIENIEAIKKRVSEIKDHMGVPTQMVLNSFLEKSKKSR